MLSNQPNISKKIKLLGLYQSAYFGKSFPLTTTFDGYFETKCNVCMQYLEHNLEAYFIFYSM